MPKKSRELVRHVRRGVALPHFPIRRPSARPWDATGQRPARRAVCWRPGAALCAAGLALALAGAAPAQAQSNATTRIWSADMTVGESGGSAGFFVGSGGTLSDTTFTFKGVEHTISTLAESGETIFFWISPGFGTSTNHADVTAYIEDLRLSFTQGSTSYGYNFDDRAPTVANGNTVFIFADTTRSWSSGEDIEVRLTTRAPSEPTDVRAQAGARSVSLTWDVPDTNGGGISAQRGIYRYELRYKVGSGSYGDWQTVPGGGSARSHTLTDLDVGVKHTFQLRARNGYGSVVYSGEVSATPKVTAAITDIDIETEPTAIGSFSGFHGTGDFIQVRVTFNRDVLGTPESGVASLKLLVGGKERTAQAQFTQLPLRSFVFVYTIQADDVDLDGITVPADALALPQGGALQDTDGVDAVLTHAAYEFPAHVVNPPLPHITGIEVSSPLPEAGFYSSALGDSFRLRMTFSEPVTRVGGGVTRFTVRVGDDDVFATYSSGSGTTELTFELTYGLQHTAPDGVSVPAGSLTLSGGTTVKGPYGRDAVLTHGAYAFPQHLVNELPPPAHFTGIEVESSPGSGGFYATGDTIELHVIFSGPVTAAGSAPGTPPDVALKLRVGSAERSAEYLLGSGTNKLRFLYTVQAGDEDRDGVSAPANALSLGTGMTLKTGSARTWCRRTGRTAPSPATS